MGPRTPCRQPDTRQEESCADGHEQHADPRIAFPGPESAQEEAQGHQAKRSQQEERCSIEPAQGPNPQGRKAHGIGKMYKCDQRSVRVGQGPEFAPQAMRRVEVEAEFEAMERLQGRAQAEEAKQSHPSNQVMTASQDLAAESQLIHES